MRSLNIAIDPDTRKIIPGGLTIEASGAIEIRLPFTLESPNKTLWAHWRVKHRAKNAWMARLQTVIADAAGVNTLAGVRGGPMAALGLAKVTDRRLVKIERLTPSSRHFIRDTDNLVFSAKGLIDCIRQLGFLRDDSSQWTTLTVTQSVSPDRRAWTIVRIEIPADVSVQHDRSALFGGLK